MLELQKKSDLKINIKVDHHTKYREIHGKDEIIRIDMGEHTRLHKKLRKEGKCNIPSEKLGKISRSANYRKLTYKPEWIRKQTKKDVEKMF